MERYKYMSFATLKKNRKKFAEILKKAADQTSKRESFDDERVWKLTRDKAGNGFAIIRFIPSPDSLDDPDSGLPWVKVHNHSFKGPTGRWYIENCRTTMDNSNDPVCDANSALWDKAEMVKDKNKMASESYKNIVRTRKRKLNYYSNIYVIKDSANPDNEGKVFLFRYGKTIFDKLKEAMGVTDEDSSFVDEDKVDFNPFDIFDGANFRLKSRLIGGSTQANYITYDKSTFDSQTPLVVNDKGKPDEDEMNKIIMRGYSLNEFTDQSNFKTYDVLKERFLQVVKGTTDVDISDDVNIDTNENSISGNDSQKLVNEDDDELDLAIFEKLAEED